MASSDGKPTNKFRANLDTMPHNRDVVSAKGRQYDRKSPLVLGNRDLPWKKNLKIQAKI